MRVYFDTCAFIEAFERRSPLSAALLKYLNWTRNGWPLVVTSELTLAELLDLPLRQGQERLTVFYDGFVRSSDTLLALPVSRAVLRLSADLKASGYCSKLPDAIHLATAVDTGCECFVTNDRRLRFPHDIQPVGMNEQMLLDLLDSFR